MRSSVVRRPATVAMAAILFALAGCASRVAVTRMVNGNYHLKCTAPLPVCLNHAQGVCSNNRYIVVRAADIHDYHGTLQAHMEVRTSEAIVSCGERTKLGPHLDPMAMPPAPDCEPVAPARPCIPGATQTCVGPGACQGGQSCLPDGGGYSPCACTPAAPTPTDRSF